MLAEMGNILKMMLAHERLSPPLLLTLLLRASSHVRRGFHINF